MGKIYSLLNKFVNNNIQRSNLKSIKKMKSSIGSRHLIQSKSCSKIKDLHEGRKPKTIKILDVKEPKLDLIKSSKSSYFNYDRNLSKNQHKKRIKIVGNSRILQSNKNTTRLLSDTEDKGKNIRTLRTFSPSIEKISSKLSEKRREKQILRKQEEMIERLENVLEEYKSELFTCRTEKQNLRKQNRKLKDKISTYFSAEKYRTHQYNVLS